MEIPRVLNWVKARSECSIEQMFMLLKERAAADVEAIKQTPRGTLAKFGLILTSDDRFTVTRQADSAGFTGGDGVAFVRTAHGIDILWARTDQAILTVSPTLCADGECRLKPVNSDDALELWQVSQRALEKLFFAS